MLHRIRGWKSVVHDAIDFTVDLVEEGHESAARNALRILGLVSPNNESALLVDELRRATTSVALDSVRATNRLVQRLTDTGLDSSVALGLLPFLKAKASGPIAMRSDVVGSAAWLSDGAIGLVNGAVGDYLHREHNTLDLGLVLRYRDRYDEFPEATKIAVFVHGLGTTEWSWCFESEANHGDASVNFGTLLERDLGFAPVFVRYNSGLNVCESGELLAEALQALTRASAIEEIVLIGHSMGGLVVRSACHEASQSGHPWVERVSRVVSLGSPHRGAPLEQLGHLATTLLGAVDLPGTRIPAAILKKRSAGIRDLRAGTIARVEPEPREVPLLDHIRYHFASSTLTRDRDHPVGKLLGDAMVLVPSASGPALSVPHAPRRFPIAIETFGGIAHHQLQNHPDVYAWLLGACGALTARDAAGSGVAGKI